MCETVHVNRIRLLKIIHGWKPARVSWRSRRVKLVQQIS